VRRRSVKKTMGEEDSSNEGEEDSNTKGEEASNSKGEEASSKEVEARALAWRSRLGQQH
jgi:hypothetical protein